MIHKKHTKFIFSFFMALIMSCLMSAAITFINLGLVENFLFLWFQAYWKAFIIAFPIIFFVAPLVQKITVILIKSEG